MRVNEQVPARVCVSVFHLAPRAACELHASAACDFEEVALCADPTPSHADARLTDLQSCCKLERSRTSCARLRPFIYSANAKLKSRDFPRVRARTQSVSIIWHLNINHIVVPIFQLFLS